MRSILQYVILDNTVEDYLVFAVAVLFILLLRRYLAAYIAGFLFRLMQNTSWKTGKEVFVNLLKGPIHIFIVLLVAFLSLDRLKFSIHPQFQDTPRCRSKSLRNPFQAPFSSLLLSGCYCG